MDATRIQVHVEPLPDGSGFALRAQVGRAIYVLDATDEVASLRAGRVGHDGRCPVTDSAHLDLGEEADDLTDEVPFDVHLPSTPPPAERALPVRVGRLEAA